MNTHFALTAENKKVASNGVIAMIFLLATELMFFAGLISAYIINRSAAMVWPPFNQPRLPIEVTALNTVVLLASAIVLFFFSRKINPDSYKEKSTMHLLSFAMILGLGFLIIQGTEWVNLIHYGLTTSSSLYGAFFYLIIGAHAVHVIAGLLILMYLYFSSKSQDYFELKNSVTVCSMYWYFVVGIWPVLYVLVYLA